MADITLFLKLKGNDSFPALTCPLFCNHPIQNMGMLVAVVEGTLSPITTDTESLIVCPPDRNRPATGHTTQAQHASLPL